MNANPGQTVKAEESGARLMPTAPERITVALIPKAAADLQALQDRSGLSKTNLVNRAITLYEFIDAQVSEGHEVIIRDPRTRETQIVRFL